MMRNIKSLAAALAPHGDALDADRGEVRQRLQESEHTPLNEVYNLAVEIWAVIASDVWNSEDRSAEAMATAREIQTLLAWVLGPGREESGQAHGNAMVVFAQVSHVLGDDHAALVALDEAIDGLDRSSTTWAAACETKIRILIGQNHTDAALALVALLQSEQPTNDYARAILDAYELDVANEKAMQARGDGPAANYDLTDIHVTPETFAAVQQTLTERFQADIAAIQASGKEPAEQAAAMQQLTAMFGAACTTLQQKVFGG